VPRHLRVAAGFAVGNREQRLPRAPLEVRAAELERQIECAAPAREILIELTNGFGQHRMIGLLGG
jgi:hypothetical protein